MEAPPRAQFMYNDLRFAYDFSALINNNHQKSISKADFLFVGVVGTPRIGKGSWRGLVERETCPIIPSHPNQTYIEFVLATPY